MLRAARNNSQSAIVAQPLMLLLDGGKSRFQDGETIPVPRTSTTDSGAAVTTGYDMVETGLIIEAALREVSPTTAQCTLSIELTAVTDYVETTPITKGQKFSTMAVLQTHGTYLLGSMPMRQNQRSAKGSVFPSLFKRELTDADVQIWLRCYRISGPVKPAIISEGLPHE